MRKILTLILLLCSLTALAFDTNANFGMKQQRSAEGYQQYVGKSFFSEKPMEH